MDAGQQRGEIASPLSFHGNAHVGRSESAPSTFEDLGLTKERVAEARILRDHYSEHRKAPVEVERDTISAGLHVHASLACEALRPQAGAIR